MSFRNFKSDSYCVGGRYRSDTKNLYDYVNSKTSKIQVGGYSISSCDGKSR